MIMLKDKFYGHLKDYLTSTNSYDSFPDDLNILAQHTFVAYPEKNRPYAFNTIVVQPEFLQHLHKDDIFDELADAYPVKVQRPDGVYSFLKKDKRLVKDLYYIITKSDRTVHDHIMKCLQTELAHREQTGGMQWMKTLSKWVQSKEWENFEDLVADGPSLKQTNIYGTQLE